MVSEPEKRIENLGLKSLVGKIGAAHTYEGYTRRDVEGFVDLLLERVKVTDDGISFDIDEEDLPPPIYGIDGTRVGEVFKIWNEEEGLTDERSFQDVAEDIGAAILTNGLDAVERWEKLVNQIYDGSVNLEEVLTAFVECSGNWVYRVFHQHLNLLEVLLAKVDEDFGHDDFRKACRVSAVEFLGEDELSDKSRPALKRVGYRLLMLLEHTDLGEEAYEIVLRGKFPDKVGLLRRIKSLDLPEGGVRVLRGTYGSGITETIDLYRHIHKNGGVCVKLEGYGLTRIEKPWDTKSFFRFVGRRVQERLGYDTADDIDFEDEGITLEEIIDWLVWVGNTFDLTIIFDNMDYLAGNCYKSNQYVFDDPEGIMQAFGQIAYPREADRGVGVVFAHEGFRYNKRWLGPLRNKIPKAEFKKFPFLTCKETIELAGISGIELDSGCASYLNTLTGGHMLLTQIVLHKVSKSFETEAISVENIDWAVEEVYQEHKGDLLRWSMNSVDLLPSNAPVGSIWAIDFTSSSKEVKERLGCYVSLEGRSDPIVERLLTLTGRHYYLTGKVLQDISRDIQLKGKACDYLTMEILDQKVARVVGWYKEQLAFIQENSVNFTPDKAPEGSIWKEDLLE